MRSSRADEHTGSLLRLHLRPASYLSGETPSPSMPSGPPPSSEKVGGRRCGRKLFRSFDDATALDEIASEVGRLSACDRGPPLRQVIFGRLPERFAQTEVHQYDFGFARFRGFSRQ